MLSHKSSLKKYPKCKLLLSHLSKSKLKMKEQKKKKLLLRLLPNCLSTFHQLSSLDHYYQDNK